MGEETQKEDKKLPVHLIIPAINVDSTIQQVGITSDGEMATPNSFVQAGWFKFGPAPGENGSAVIAGHLNGENNELGVFANLHKLKAGDKLFVEDDKGVSVDFVVREIRTYDKGHADEVFNWSTTSHLNLITCYGLWDLNKKTYNKRLVVFADKVESPF